MCLCSGWKPSHYQYPFCHSRRKTEKLGIKPLCAEKINIILRANKENVTVVMNGDKEINQSPYLLSNLKTDYKLHQSTQIRLSKSDCVNCCDFPRWPESTFKNCSIYDHWYVNQNGLKIWFLFNRRGFLFWRGHLAVINRRRSCYPAISFVMFRGSLQTIPATIFIAFGCKVY